MQAENEEATKDDSARSIVVLEPCPTDIQAALTVLGRRPSSAEDEYVDLRHVRIKIRQPQWLRP